MENQMPIDFKKFDFTKITKVGIISRVTDKNSEKLISKPEMVFDNSSNDFIKEFTAILADSANKWPYGYSVQVEWVNYATYEIKMYLNDGKWIRAEYRIKQKEHNFEMDNASGSVTVNPEEMDKLIMNAVGEIGREPFDLPYGGM